MKNVVVLLYIESARLLRNLSPLHTDPACKVSVLYLCDRKIRKKSEPISNPENLIRIILVWCGRWDWILTARRRSVSAALRPHCGLIHYGFFKSHALRFFVSKIKKPSVLSKAFAWCGRWDWILTARRRSVSAALRPHCGLIHYGFFKSHALRFFVSKTKKPSVLSKAFAGAADETESEPEAPASVTCFSMDFTRWSSEE